MFNPFRKKIDHPLATIKSAQALLDNIPKNDPIRALQEIGDWLQALSEEEDFRLDHMWAVLRLYDQAAQGHARKLLRDYFAPQGLSAFQENRLWDLLEGYFAKSEGCHFIVLQRYREGVKGAVTIKHEIPLLCARGIHALGGQLKMVVARYAPVDPTLWKRLAAYYSLAESLGCQETSIALFPGMDVSVNELFSKLLLWYGSLANRVNPIAGHIAERLLCALKGEGGISRSLGEQALLAFDLAQPTAPMRATADLTLHSALRFVTANGWYQQLSDMIKALEKGVIPSEVNFYGTTYDAEQVRDAAQRLLQGLTFPPPTRRSPRRKVRVNLEVAKGFNRVLERADVGLSLGTEESEVWEIENISATGFGGVIPAERAKGIQIGTLLGYRPAGVVHWGVGVVRRLSRDQENALHIGVEILSPHIVAIPLLDALDPTETQIEIGMYLNRPNDTSGETWLLLKQDAYAKSRSFKGTLHGKEYLLLPLSLLERGADYDLARYRKMEQDVGEED